MELVNIVILRLFQQDHVSEHITCFSEDEWYAIEIDNVWTARHMQSLRMLDFSAPVKQLEYRSFKFVQTPAFVVQAKHSVYLVSAYFSSYFLDQFLFKLARSLQR